MKPLNEWRALREAIACGQYGDARYHASNLRDWIVSGGVVPDEITHIAWANMVEALLHPDSTV